MNREQAREYILARATDHLQRDKSGKGYICPICGSGSGKNGTGITTKDKTHYTCWAGCFQSADIFDIIGLERGLTDYNSQLQAACDIFGITLDAYQPRSTAQEDFTYTQPSIHNSAYTTTDTQQEAEPDYTDFFLQANKDLERTDYHRGLTLDTLNRFKVGFVESWKHPKAPNAPASPRLIIPTSRHSYLARDTRAELTEEQKKYSKSKVGAVRIFNSRAIERADKPIFIVEGEIDALSIIDVGGEAVGLGSLGNAGKLLKILENQKPKKPFIIALDNEEDPKIQAKVEAAVKTLEDGLDKLGIAHYRLNPSGDYKDANEALNGNREAFKAAVAEAENIEAQALEAERDKLQREAALYSLDSFLKEIEASKRAAFIPTGFPALDNLLEGGLYSGLYIVGAISSLGKTTFALQIADNIAQTGKKVLVFSLEMARNELIAKSVSRLTLLEDLRSNSSTAHAKTTRGILTGTRYSGYSESEKQLIQTAITQYGEYASNIWITEGVGDITVATIREKVEHFIAIYKEAPVVIIDYLQIIAPYNERYTDKQNTDKAVLELKRLSRDYRLPIIGISSFNRDNYTAPVNLASFKESGAIEYSSDVLIGLQYEGMDYQEGEAEKARDKRIRELINQAIADGKNGKAQSIQVKVLKNRNGSKGDTLLNFYPMFNYFENPRNGESGGWTRRGSTAPAEKTEEKPAQSGSWDGFTELDYSQQEELPF